MNPGCLIAVVGPSGVGKDSVMAGIAAARPEVRLVQRAITRAPGQGGEDYQALSQAAFDQAAAQGAFCLYWSAHGLSYGLPKDVQADVAAGRDCLANLSRSVLGKASEVFATLRVLHITASPEVLAQRLRDRGRETATDIKARLAQADKPLPEGLDVITLSNDGTLAETVSRALSALYPDSA